MLTIKLFSCKTRGCTILYLIMALHCPFDIFHVAIVVFRCVTWYKYIVLPGVHRTIVLLLGDTTRLSAPFWRLMFDLPSQKLPGSTTNNESR